MKRRLTLETITAFLHDRYTQVGDLAPLAEGEESQALAVDADGRSLVVRVNPDRAGFDKDRLIAQRFPALPVPPVLSIDRIGDLWLCISERAPGETLQALGTRAATYGEAVVATLDAIGASDASFAAGFGPFDADGRGAFATWRDFVVAIEGPDDLVQRVRAQRYPEHGRLVHADFGSNNVLVADGTVTAVIDWSEAMIGDPLYDLANLFFWRTWLDCMDVQCSHIERHHRHRIADRDLLRCYQLRIGLQVLHEATRDGDDRLASWTLARCRSIAQT